MMVFSMTWVRIPVLLAAICLIRHVQADANQYIYGTDGNGVTRTLAVNRYPALYTGDFGDCLGGESLFNITKFDAGYYADNLTIVFHLDGTSNVRDESLMMHISVEAYGQSRFDMTFDPCLANIYSLCPLNASVPITGWAIFQVGPQQVGGIPELAFSIPDFEGFAKLQIFANSSKTEIGCFQAVMRNGNTFSQPESVATVLGVFTLVAIIASFLTAAYGISLPHMRMHYAHSLPVLLVFETFQSIFFTGALAVQWPSVLTAWWSNFAWSAGMIYSHKMVNSLDSFSGVTGNASQVGGAGSVVINNGGGLASQIYGRSLVQKMAGALKSRNTYNASNPFDYTWAGNPMAPGMPLPGTWSGFPGVLSAIGIPSADAFLVGLIWLLVALGLVALSIVSLKGVLEALASMKKVKGDRLAYFRSNWTRFLLLALQRTLFVAFFMATTLALFQFAIHGPAGPIAIAAVVFVLLLVGLVTLVAQALHTRTKLGKFHVKRDEIVFHYTTIFKVIPFIWATRSSVVAERELDLKGIAGIPFFRVQHLNDKPGTETVHDDHTFIEKHGWLSARYRLTKWWFFAHYMGYQFVRACFLGGGVNNPLAQVFGLLIFEILAFLVLVFLKPFESARNTALAVWMLSLSKILTVGLSIAFLPGFNIDRIAATVLGVIIIVIQGLVVIALMILIVLGAISSWMSLSRNREAFEPEWLDNIRVQFFERMQQRATDKRIPPEKSEKVKGKEKEGEADEAQIQLPQPYFSVNSVRRAPKIEDEDEDMVADLDGPIHPVRLDPTAPRSGTRPNRTNSVSSRYSVSSLPRAARVHRASWSSKDFSQFEQDRSQSVLAQRMSTTSLAQVAAPRDGNTGSTANLPPFGVQPQESSRSLTPPIVPQSSTSTIATLADHTNERPNDTQ
jgi:hypothetical protein